MEIPAVVSNATLDFASDFVTCAHGMGACVGAIVDYNMAIQLDPDNERALFNRAKSYYQAGFYSRSMLDYLNAALSWL